MRGADDEKRVKSLHMEDTDAEDRAKKPDNPQGSDKRNPNQGESVPEGANDGTAEPAGEGTTTGQGGASRYGGSGN